MLCPVTPDPEPKTSPRAPYMPVLFCADLPCRFCPPHVGHPNATWQRVLTLETI